MKYKNLIIGVGSTLIVYFLTYLFTKSFLPDNTVFFNIATFLYLLAGIFYLVAGFFGLSGLFSWGSGIGWSGFIFNLAGFLVRWYQTYKFGFNYIPLTNLYESLVFFGLSIAGLYLFWEFKLSRKLIGAVVFILASFIMAFAALKANAKIQPLIPALKSNWLIAHVITCFLGYGAFAVAFGAGVAYLLKDMGKFSKFLPEKTFLENFIYKTILFGFVWLTLGIITGSVWAEQAWGSYWSWDPKETWSLITWLIYAATIHLKLMKGWGGKRLSLMSIIGFLCVLFTYFGVNLILSGLHSYATS